MSYDAWKTTDPADNTLGRSRNESTQYRCCTCGWRGKGSIARSEHFYKTGHELIVPKEDPRSETPAAERKVG